jgi:hypothetical protein
MADTAAEESVQAVDFRAGQNFGKAQRTSFSMYGKIKNSFRVSCDIPVFDSARPHLNRRATPRLHLRRKSSPRSGQQPWPQLGLWV